MTGSKRNAFFILLIRLTLGIVFIQSGWGKIHNIEHVIGYFTELKIPFTTLSAHAAAWTELIAGALILVGLLTRVSSIAIFVIMTVAILTTQLTNLASWSDLLGTIEFLYALMCVGLVLVGPEKISIDEIIRAKTKSKWALFL